MDIDLYALLYNIVNETHDVNDYANESNYIEELLSTHHTIFFQQWFYPYHWSNNLVNQIFDIDNSCIYVKQSLIKSSEDNYKYIEYNNHRIYSNPNDWTYNSMIFFDLHENSPHNYNKYLHLLKDKLKEDQLNVIIDCGSSEGIFEVLVSDHYDLRNILFILFEPDESWNEYTKKTLDEIGANYFIFNKFVDVNNKLDDILQINKANVVCIKADIEGKEIEMLNGAESILKYQPLSIIATYHNQNDTENIPNVLKKYYDNVEQSDGYLLCVMNEIKYPYFRKALTIAY